MTVLELARPRRAEPSVRRHRRLAYPRNAWAVAWPAAVLLIAGLPMILSASWVTADNDGLSPYYFVSRQALGAVVGIIALWTLAHTPVHRLRALAYVLLVGSLLGLILVLTPLGTGAFGSRRWLALGPFTIQPSEFAKLAFILVGADLCVRKGQRLLTLGDAIRPLGLLFAVLGVLVALEPDLGTATVLGLLYLALLFVAAVPLRVLALIAGGGAAAFGVLAMSADYRRARVLSFLDPFADPENTGYQAVQSIVALGSGGIFGAGFGMSKQKWLYVPNAHTDFIFAVIGEEAGLIGTLAILGVFTALAYAGIRIARETRDPFARIVAAGIVVWITLQAIVNIGAVTSVLPITGVPLPFVSYGNSALICSLAAIGILMSIARESSRPEVAPGESDPSRGGSVGA